MRNILLVSLCFGLFFSSFAFAEADPAEDDTSSDAKLEQIRQQVALHSKQLETFETQIRNSKKSIERSDQALKETDNRLKKSEEDLTQLSQKKEDISAELKELELEFGSEQEGALKRIRALYMSREGEASDGLVMEALGGNFLRTSYYFSKIRKSDRMLLKRISSAIRRREEIEQEVATIYTKQKALHQQLQALRSEREKQVQERRSRYRILLEQQGKAEKAMLALEAQALRLQTVLTSLTGEKSTFLVSDTTAKTDKSYTVPQAVKRFEGNGLKKEATKLPVTGVVLKDYGKRKHDKFSDMVFQKGVEFEVSNQSSVRAIAPGKVMYVGKMPVFGNIVILDHGARVYSLYGRIIPGESLKVSSLVDGGDLVGEASNEPVYFEIRESGKPVDPQKYFQVQFRVGNKVEG